LASAVQGERARSRSAAVPLARALAARALLALAAVAASQFAWVSATNFGGVDEWVYLSLNTHHIFTFPHSNRPFALLWPWPAVLLAPQGFGGYFVVHVAYLTLAAWLTWAIVRRLAPASPRLALIAGTLALVWAPRDMARLATVQTSMNSGATFATLAALALFLESWRRGRPALLAVALGVGFLAARSYEATLGVLAGAPLLLAAVEPGPAAHPGRVRWSVAWLAGVGLFGALAAAPLLTGDRASVYQAGVLGIDRNPLHWARRIAEFYGHHLAPVVVWDVTELRYAAVPWALLAFAAAVALAHGHDAAPLALGRLVRLASLGLAQAGLGYAVLALSPAVTGATRTQFLSTPGIALFLAAGIALVGSAVPSRARAAVELTLAAVLVALATGHTLAMQREWDRTTFFPAQQRTLAALAREAPALQPNTLLLLLDEDGTWPFALTFRHAVKIAYGDRVIGHALGADALLYAAAISDEGAHVAPWPVIRAAWHEPPTFHRFDEIVVCRLTGGQLALLDEWPVPRLRPLPPLARYAPRARIAAPLPKK
jgi:hypothetical protein